MHCLDRTLASPSGWIWIVALALGGCSDDGLAPPIDTDASTGVVATGPVSGSDGTTTAPPGPTTENATTNESVGMVTGSTGPADADSSDGGSTTGGPLPPMGCESARECVLVDDCCECAAHHVDDVLQECPVACEETMCAALGIPEIEAVCQDGRCELEPRDCSGMVACDAPSPKCPEGTLPEVEGAVGGVGGCWTGACIPVGACDPVPSCEHCDDATEVCTVTESQLGTYYSCRVVPEECAGMPTCDCMPPGTCVPPYDTCEDGDGLLVCSCPEC